MNRFYSCFCALLLTIGMVYGQEFGSSSTLLGQESLNSSSTHCLSNRTTAFKLNGLLAIGVINPAIELSLSKHISFQMEGMGVFFNRDFLSTGVPLVLGTTFIEGRYYFKETFRQFYVGPNIGWGVWKMNKDIAPGYSYGHNSIQYGNNVMMGLTLGFQWVFSEHWSLDLSWGLGWQHAFYDGFQDNDGDGIYESYRDTSIPIDALNQSAEWMPAYKGGAFISYRF